MTWRRSKSPLSFELEVLLQRVRIITPFQGFSSPNYPVHYGAWIRKWGIHTQCGKMRLLYPATCHRRKRSPLAKQLGTYAFSILPKNASNHNYDTQHRNNPAGLIGALLSCPLRCQCCQPWLHSLESNLWVKFIPQIYFRRTSIHVNSSHWWISKTSISVDMSSSYAFSSLGSSL
jgi:hypothetical protein